MREMTNNRPNSQTMRTFYVIWFGQLISTLGSGLTGFALGVYVYESTRSATAFALSILAFTIPGVFFSPIAGALVDRFPRRWMMILSDTGAAIEQKYAQKIAEAYAQDLEHGLDQYWATNTPKE